MPFYNHGKLKQIKFCYSLIFVHNVSQTLLSIWTLIGTRRETKGVLQKPPVFSQKRMNLRCLEQLSTFLQCTEKILCLSKQKARKVKLATHNTRTGSRTRYWSLLKTEQIFTVFFLQYDRRSKPKTTTQLKWTELNRKSRFYCLTCTDPYRPNRPRSAARRSTAPILLDLYIYSEN